MMRDVGVGQLVEELEQRGDRLPFEIGAFVALEACEGLLQEAVRLEPDDVRVTLEGSVLVADSAKAAAPDEAARSLVSVLARLLIAAGPGVPPYLLELVKDTKTGQVERGLRDLHDAIEASLIPINRSASRRVLARLVRESDRPPRQSAPDVDPRELDAELDELLRDPALRTLEPSQAQLPLRHEEEPVTERIRVPRELREEPAVRAGAAAEPAVARTEPAQQPIEPITATIRKWQPEDSPAEAEPAAEAEAEAEAAAEPAPEPAPVSASAPASAPVPAPAPVPVPVSAPTSDLERASAPGVEPTLETATESVFAGGSVKTSESIPAPEPMPERQSRPIAPPEGAPERPSRPQSLPRRRGGWGIWLLAAALGLVAYGLIATGTLDSVRAPAPEAPAPVVGGTIDVTVTPPDAQIFLFIGRGPAVAEGLAVDGSHEFVVFDQGLRPSRAVVPKGATWTSTAKGPLYELAVQAQPSDGSSESTGLGLPQTNPVSESNGPTGAVRVITNPPAAKVYRFVGVGPSARISVSSIHEGQELLVYHPGHETRRAVIGPSDWQRAPDSDAYSASLQVQLPTVVDSPVAEPAED